MSANLAWELERRRLEAPPRDPMAERIDDLERQVEALEAAVCELARRLVA